MKSLLLISLLSVLLSVCNNKAEKQPETEAAAQQEQTIVKEAETPVLDGAVDAPEEKPASEKPERTGEMPDTARRQIIEHGAPDKARNDSVKAAKTKGKF